MKKLIPIIFAAVIFTFVYPAYSKVPAPKHELSAVEKELFGTYILIVSGLCNADVITLIPLKDDPQVFAWFEDNARKWRLTLELNAIQVFTAIKRDGCV